MDVRIGLQLYSVRQSLASDPWGTLAKIAEVGFTRLEAANHNARNDPGVGFGVPSTQLRSQLGELGLSIMGCHINPLHLDILPRALDYQAELGNTQIGCDIEFYPNGDRDFVLGRCEVFNESVSSPASAGCGSITTTTSRSSSGWATTTSTT